jgi:hypothetical protein
MGNIKSLPADDLPSIPSYSKVTSIRSLAPGSKADKLDGTCTFIEAEKNGREVKLQVTLLSRIGDMEESEVKRLVEEEVNKYLKRAILIEELTIDRQAYTCIIKVV